MQLVGLLSAAHLVLVAAVGSVWGAVPPVPLSISVSAGVAPVHSVAPEYVSFNLDYHYDGEEWPSWRGASVLNMSLDEPNLKYLTAALAPAHLRVGGSEGDLVVYVLDGFPCALPPGQNVTTNPVPFCLDAQRWSDINAFARDAGISVAFGLNAMAGRVNAGSPMNTSNIGAFLSATAAAGFNASNTLTFLEFGNELEFKADAPVYAADLTRVAAMVEAAWPDAATRPRLVVSGRPLPRVQVHFKMHLSSGSYTAYFARTPLNRQMTKIRTRHTGLHSCRSFPLALFPRRRGMRTLATASTPIFPPRLLTPAFLIRFLAKPLHRSPRRQRRTLPATSGSERRRSRGTRGATARQMPSPPHSGTLISWAHLPERIVSRRPLHRVHTNLWCILKMLLPSRLLFALASLGLPSTAVQCRQTLFGGNYELVDKTTKSPNPDFWIAHLWST